MGAATASSSGAGVGVDRSAQRPEHSHELRVVRQHLLRQTRHRPSPCFFRQVDVLVIFFEILWNLKSTQFSPNVGPLVALFENTYPPTGKRLFLDQGGVVGGQPR